MNHELFALNFGLIVYSIIILLLFYLPFIWICLSIKKHREEMEAMRTLHKSSIEAVLKEMAKLRSAVQILPRSASSVSGVRCPHCGEALDLPDTVQPGQRILCPYCGEKFEKQ